MPLKGKALPTTSSQRSNPTRAQIFIVERQSTNVFIKLDGMLQALFRLFHAARDARVAGKAESDHGNLGMYRLRSQQNGFRLLYTLDPPNRIGETDPPDLRFQAQPSQGGWQPRRPCPISWLPCKAEHRVPRTSLRFLSSGAISSRTMRRIVEHSQLEIAARSKDMPLPIGFQGIGDSWRKKKSAFVATQVTSRKAPAVTASINERPEMMILRLPAQWAFFFHGLAAGDPLAGDHRRSSPASQMARDGRNRSVVSWMKAKSGSHCGCSILR